jgi:hypothetical protein
MKVSYLLDQIDLGNLALPEFQRGYVWNTNQVRGLMSSLYRRHPVGGLLIWSTTIQGAQTRGHGPSPVGGSVDLLLDGQQRITTLYGIIRGKPPQFFEGNAAAFSGLHFNLLDESFEFYAPLKMKDNPAWIDVSKAMQTDDLTELLEPLEDRLSDHGLKLMTAISRLNRLQGIREIDLHAEQISGVDMTVDIVVDIFNRVNSGGTKLSKGDLALAKICASWPEARQELRTRLRKWRDAGYSFKLEWFLRCVTTVTTGSAYFTALANEDATTIQEGVIKAEQRVDQLLNIIAGRLGLDHTDVLGSPYSVPLMARYLENRGGSIDDPKDRDRLLYWYIHTFLWGRYAGSTESVLSQDLNLIELPGDPLDHLIGQLRQLRGDLRLRPDDFRTSTRGSRFYPMLYMLTRVYGARDLGSGLPLHKHLLGHLMRLELHHIFPKKNLYDHDYSRNEVNAVGNFMFLTQDTNLKIRARDPAEYLAALEKTNPGVLASQWVPSDPQLWTYDRYHEFLEERRRLLADAGNRFLDSLSAGTVPEPAQIPDAVAPVVVAPVVWDSADEESQLLEINEWVVQQGLPEGEFYAEHTDPVTGAPLTTLDLAWKDGLQVGLSQPVAILLNEDSEADEVANNAGYLFFTDIESFRRYVDEEILATRAAAD